MMTHDEMIAVIAAHKEGRDIQYSGNGIIWHNISDRPLFNFAVQDYRIKPEPKIRPWKLGEVPVGGVVKNKGTQNIYLILGSGVSGFDEVILPLEVRYSRVQMLEYFEHSTDGGKTWKHCGVEE